MSSGVRMLACVAVCWFVTVPALADPVSLEPGTWHSFTWGRQGPVDPGFSLASEVPVHLRVVDCCVTGDAFDLLIDDVLVASSPSVPTGIQTARVDGDAAWGDQRLSRLLVTLAAGQYGVDVSIRERPITHPQGTAYIRADPVPEPATLTLVGLGAAALALRRHRGRRVRQLP